MTLKFPRTRNKKKNKFPSVIVAIDRRRKFVLTPRRNEPSTGLLLIRYLAYQDVRLKQGRRLEPRERRALYDIQLIVNEKLSALLRGEDARKIFKLDRPKRRGERKDIGREQAMCQEVLRLRYLHDFDEADAKEAVTEKFNKFFDKNIDIRTVQRAVKAWRDAPGFDKLAIETYENRLRLYGLLR
jgi:hypothetical protein